MGMPSFCVILLEFLNYIVNLQSYRKTQTCESNGGAENAGLENAGPNLQGWKRRDKRVWNAK